MRLNNYLLENKELIFLDLIKKECSDIIKLYKKNKEFFYRGTTTKYMGIIDSNIPRKNRKPKDTPEVIHNKLDNVFNKMFGWKARSEGLFVSGNIAVAEGYGKPFVIFPVNGFKYIWSDKIKDLYINKIMHFSIDEEDIIEAYTDEYGPEGKGKWLFKNELYINIKDIPDFISSDNIKIPFSFPSDVAYVNIKYYDKEKNRNETYKVLWIPDRNLMDVRYDIMQDLLISTCEEWPLLYTDKNLDKALKSGNEVMIKCKKYYYIDYFHYMKNIEYIWSKLFE